MLPDDREFEALLRSADPARTLHDQPFTVRELATMERIIASPAPKTRASRIERARLSLVGSALIAFVAVVAVVLALSPTQTAVALTPPPLDFTPTGFSAQEVLQMSIDELRSQPAEGAARRHTESLGWYLHLDHIGEETRIASISPEVTTVTWHPDQSGRVTIVAADSSQIDGATGGIPQDSQPPGAVLSDMRLSPGTFDAPTTEPPPTTLAGMRSWLQKMGLSEDPGAADYMHAAETAMFYWTLTDRQHSLILELIQQCDDVATLGRAFDRKGREVWGMAAVSTMSPNFRTLLLVSTASGRIVGIEAMLTAPVDGIPAGAVTSYTLWE